MTRLNEVAPGTTVRVKGVSGNVRLLTRLSSVGIMPGSTVVVRRNDKHRPVLVFERDTLLAINREEAQHIEVEEVA
ncbi:FeoA domain [Slackia heliotrinireducens]|jgi:ferrous iron transport protein A|uniref:Fe2+ transport system protein A n=1 Tax=Slackia heliotrinireducens (strain ATCC 29202 / DSM 20476 / NCTC 11029 / RHS 1) TaxID=471855 RepID=C7N7A7_SLAHD|nr:FeoA family protein [Slackia heliotrinireducens]ACV22792.1 Fe2+ transport system protein A [Slackia heliotrinireducens DSM 20476]VEH01486.1 FeoA domain [Slackia heliotrinireducens]